MRYAEAIKDATALLSTRSTSASLDAELLLAKVCGISRSAVIARSEQLLDDPEQQALAALVLRRVDGEPMAYLIGSKEFWSLTLRVTPDVLVPRPETELLVEQALAHLAGIAQPTVLDLGTGSGAIALALASERPDATVMATDQSAAVLAVARDNAARHQLSNVSFRQGDWYQPVAALCFDLVASNPPYLAEDDAHWPGLLHEPRQALASGADGLRALAIIAQGAMAHLKPAGRVMLEHGATQGSAVRALLEQAGFIEVSTHRDLAGLDRMTSGRHPG